MNEQRLPRSYDRGRTAPSGDNHRATGRDMFVPTLNNARDVEHIIFREKIPDSRKSNGSMNATSGSSHSQDRKSHRNEARGPSARTRNQRTSLDDGHDGRNIGNLRELQEALRQIQVDRGPSLPARPTHQHRNVQQSHDYGLSNDKLAVDGWPAMLLPSTLHRKQHQVPKSKGGGNHTGFQMVSMKTTNPLMSASARDKRKFDQLPNDTFSPPKSKKIHSDTKMNYTISTDDTGSDAQRAKKRFMAISGHTPGSRTTTYPEKSRSKPKLSQGQKIVGELIFVGSDEDLGRTRDEKAKLRFVGRGDYNVPRLPAKEEQEARLERSSRSSRSQSERTGDRTGFYEINNTRGTKRGALYEDDLKRRRDGKHYSIEIREPIPNFAREHARFGSYYL